MVSIAILAVFIAENTFSDEVLFLMLKILSYSSFIVFLLSALLFIKLIARIAKRDLDVRSLILLSLVTAILFLVMVFGAGLFFLDIFLGVISNGNIPQPL